MMELYLHSPICLQGIVFNYLSTLTPLPLPLPSILILVFIQKPPFDVIYMMKNENKMKNGTNYSDTTSNYIHY
jgi:hypothetical protein